MPSIRLNVWGRVFEKARTSHDHETPVYSDLHLNEERKKVGWNKWSVSGLDEHAGNGLRPYPGLRLRKRYVSSLK